MAFANLLLNLRLRLCGRVACSGDELADTTGSLDSLLSNFGEHLGADDAGFSNELALSADLEEAL